MGLYEGPLNGFFPVDTMTFPEQLTDFSSARMPNGSGDFVITDMITFSSNNDNASGLEEQIIDPFYVYPNPVRDVIYFENLNSNISDLRVYNAHGQVVYSDEFIDSSVYLSHLPAGAYLMRISSNGNVEWQKFIKQ